MLQRLEKSQQSIAEVMIRNFNKDDGLKESLKFLDSAIDSIEGNCDYSEELALLKITRFAVREKILLLAYE
jgi:hypothetical protein